MTKVFAVFGAGSGLGSAIARRYGKEGYSVALVARRREPLEKLAAQLASEEITASVFPGDLSQAANVPAIVAAIGQQLGSIDALYFGPITPEYFVPAFSLTTELARQKTELLFFSLVAAVNEVLPAMRERAEGGAILVGLGGSAVTGLPFVSGPGPAMAAARHYLSSLHGELHGEGIHVGVLITNAIIKDSAFHRATLAGEIETRLPPGVVIPEVEPAELADLLWNATVSKAPPEIVFPAQ